MIGSVNLAARGASAASILGRYFPGATITGAGPRLTPNPPRLEPAPPAVVSREPSDLLLSLPDGDEGERKAIAQLTARARDDMARTLG